MYCTIFNFFFIQSTPLPYRDHVLCKAALRAFFNIWCCKLTMIILFYHTSHYATPHLTTPRLQRRRRLWLDKDSNPPPLHPQLHPLNRLVHANCHENTHINLASFVLLFLSSDPLPHTSDKSADQPAAERCSAVVSLLWPPSPHKR